MKQIDYDAYGNVIHDTNPALEIPFGFAGGLKDSHTGLIRFGYRDYEPETGRWTARDPIGFAGGYTNLYGYVGGSPIQFVDPTGLECYYSLSYETMSCYSDTGQMTHSSDGWHSDAGDNGSPIGDYCQDNPSAICSSIEDFGPIPQGEYTLTGTPQHRIGTGTTRRNLSPASTNDMSGRSDFQTHARGNINTCSEGCVVNTDRDIINDWNDYVDGNIGETLYVID